MSTCNANKAEHTMECSRLVNEHHNRFILKKNHCLFCCITTLISVVQTILVFQWKSAFSALLKLAVDTFADSKPYDVIYICLSLTTCKCVTKPHCWSKNQLLCRCWHEKLEHKNFFLNAKVKNIERWGVNDVEEYFEVKS